MEFNYLPHRAESNALNHLSTDVSLTQVKKSESLGNEKLSCGPKLIKVPLSSKLQLKIKEKFFLNISVGNANLPCTSSCLTIIKIFHLKIRNLIVRRCLTKKTLM